MENQDEIRSKKTKTLLIIDGNLGTLIFGVPLLVSGALFLVVCRRQAQ